MNATLLAIIAPIYAVSACAAKPLPPQIEVLYKTDLALDAITLADGRSAIYVRQRANETGRATKQSLWRVDSKKPRGKPRGIWNMISEIDEKPKRASGYQTPWE